MSNTAYTIILEMFEQRNWEVVALDDAMITVCKNPGSSKLEYACAFVPATLSKFNVERFQHYVSLSRSFEIDHCIVVYAETATAPARKMIDMMPGFTMELFCDDELQYNPTKHILTPEHSLYAKAASSEAVQFKSKYGQGLPGLLRTDPIARFLGFQRGDIVRIKRHGGLVTYRLVK